MLGGHVAASCPGATVAGGGVRFSSAERKGNGWRGKKEGKKEKDD